MPYKDKNDPRLIAYKKAYYEKTKANRYSRVKHNIYKWRESNPEKYKIIKQEYYKDNKMQILERQKISYLKHREKRISYEKLSSENLDDRYMKKHLLKIGYTRQDLRKNPELIESHKLIIKTKRLCKTSQN